MFDMNMDGSSDTFQFSNDVFAERVASLASMQIAGTAVVSQRGVMASRFVNGRRVA